jgi:hypothetical protein
MFFLLFKPMPLLYQTDAFALSEGIGCVSKSIAIHSKQNKNGHKKNTVET